MYKIETLPNEESVKKMVFVLVVLIVITIITIFSVVTYLIISDRPIEGCDENWQCGDWGDCQNEIKARTCNDLNNCGTKKNKPSTSSTCSLGCVEDWECSNWTECSDGSQTRTCEDKSECDSAINKPKELQNCGGGSEFPDFDEEWEIYEESVSAINNQDIAALNSITYSDITLCFNDFDAEICWEIFSIGTGFLRSHFSSFEKDSKQTIIFSSLEYDSQSNNYQRDSVYFVRDSENTKILLFKSLSGLSEEKMEDSDKDGRINEDEDCSGLIYNSFPENCIQTDMDKKDTDGDGWWDGTEVEARTDPNDPNSYLFK